MPLCLLATGKISCSARQQVQQLPNPGSIEGRLGGSSDGTESVQSEDEFGVLPLETPGLGDVASLNMNHCQIPEKGCEEALPSSFKEPVSDEISE